MTRIWDEFIPAADAEIYRAAGYGARSPWGSRPALLVVDVNYNFVGDRPEPILDSIRTFRNSCGEAGWEAVHAIRELLAAARTADVPVFYTTQQPDASSTLVGGWARKNSRVSDDGDAERAVFGVRIVDEIAPSSTDVVITKDKPSAFFATPLVSYLNHLHADTLIIVGGTTSGCVRASVIDAFSYNYTVVVVEDGCFDRSAVSHAVNLFEIHAKYADVVSLADVVAYLRGLPNGAASPVAGDPAPL
jgi:maleamate amidohydrolase